MGRHTQPAVLLDNFVTCFHVGQIVESPLKRQVKSVLNIRAH
jgi:hypothetical protein